MLEQSSKFYYVLKYVLLNKKYKKKTVPYATSLTHVKEMKV